MPRRAKPGNRERIEAELSPEVLAALVELCTLLGVPRDLWQRVPPLQYLGETSAVFRLAARLRAEQQESTEGALMAAAFRLGVSPATIESRERRAFRIARQAEEEDEAA